MINIGIELILKWTRDCVLTGKATREEIAEDDDPVAEPKVDAINRPKDLKYSITDCKLYISVVTLQEKYKNKLYAELKLEFTWMLNGVNTDHKSLINQQQII